MQETQVQSPGWDDPLEEEMPTHSSILASKIPWTAKPSKHEVAKVRHDCACTHAYMWTTDLFRIAGL